MSERIKGLLEKMSKRERKILSLRFGLKDGVPHTLRDTAKHFGITRERVRQIEGAAMKKIREMMLQQEKEGPHFMRKDKTAQHFHRSAK
jgi:RNA polymerase primary sigma factor